MQHDAQSGLLLLIVGTRWYYRCNYLVEILLRVIVGSIVSEDTKYVELKSTVNGVIVDQVAWFEESRINLLCFLSDL